MFKRFLLFCFLLFSVHSQLCTDPGLTKLSVCTNNVCEDDATKECIKNPTDDVTFCCVDDDKEEAIITTEPSTASTLPSKKCPDGSVPPLPCENSVCPLGDKYVCQLIESSIFCCPYQKPDFNFKTTTISTSTLMTTTTSQSHICKDGTEAGAACENGECSLGDAYTCELIGKQTYCCPYKATTLPVSTTVTVSFPEKLCKSGSSSPEACNNHVCALGDGYICEIVDGENRCCPYVPPQFEWKSTTISTVKTTPAEKVCKDGTTSPQVCEKSKCPLGDGYICELIEHTPYCCPYRQPDFNFKTTTASTSSTGISSTTTLFPTTSTITSSTSTEMTSTTELTTTAASPTAPTTTGTSTTTTTTTTSPTTKERTSTSSTSTTTTIPTTIVSTLSTASTEIRSTSRIATTSTGSTTQTPTTTTTKMTTTATTATNTPTITPTSISTSTTRVPTSATAIAFTLTSKIETTSTKQTTTPTTITTSNPTTISTATTTIISSTTSKKTCKDGTKARECSNNVCPFDFSIPCQQSGDKSWCCDEIQRTTPNGDCKDKIAGCQNKTKMCENPFYEKLMSKMCAMTCNLCNSQYVVATKTTKRWISCSDTTTDCAKRKKEGYCEDESISVEQKKQECICSCSLCD